MKIIRAPFLNERVISLRAEDFRNKYWKSNQIPVDIEKIIETGLGIEIIPIPELTHFCDTDALITSNWKSIHVDEKGYSDERYYPKLRFSLAHEIGHYVLHRDTYALFGIKDFTDFYNFIEEIDIGQYNFFESQANKFANYLLAPRDKLLLLVEKIEKNQGVTLREIKEKLGDDVVNEYLSDLLCDEFGVNNFVIKYALNSMLR